MPESKTESKTVFFDGKKAVNIESLPPEAWVTLSGNTTPGDIDILYSTISWLYRCVSLRGNSVAAMPFEIRKGNTAVYEFDGTTSQDTAPKDLPWLGDLPSLLGRVEVAAALGGRAYFERKKSVMGNALEFGWLVPWSVTPNYNRQTGELINFTRSFGEALRQPITLDIEDVIHFWLPDYAVENGVAINYPGKAVLQNAAVIGSLDLFLKGYFDRGMIKATLLKYQQQLTPDESKRVKEWWRRVFLGVKSAFASEVVRGDFDVMTIGDGIKDLRDGALTKDEKDSIAVGMGIPPSKLLPVGVNRATKDADDRAYIEDTIIPEVGWIYRVVDKQILNDLGFSIVALPQLLRVMQTDEVERSEAFRNYVGNGVSPGYTVNETESILGIHVPDNVREEENRQTREESQAATPPPPTIEQRTLAPLPDVVKALDWRDERDQFLRWLKNRSYTAVKVDDFKTAVLTHDEKIDLAYDAARKNYKASALDGAIDDYGDSLAKFVRDNLNGTKEEFKSGFVFKVSGGLLEIFKQAVGIEEDEDLSISEKEQYDELLLLQINAVDGYVDTIFNNKGVIFNTVRENLQEIGANLGGRLQMWKNAARQFWNRGLIVGRHENDMKWNIGATEQSCSDCLFYNGQVKTREEWLSLAGILIYPQSRALECNGYNCDCSLSLN